MKKLGVLTAMEEELSGVLEQLNVVRKTENAGRIFYEGLLEGKDVVVAFSKWGKVASAMTATMLFERYDIQQFLFMGVSGGLNSQVKVGDIVIAERLYQHDLDVRPILKRYEIPLLFCQFINTTSGLRESFFENISNLIQSEEHKNWFREAQLSPRCFVGDIGSGDQFIGSAFKKEELLRDLPSLFCVEMEGAAVAQVCYEYNIPFLIVRSISDSANDKAEFDFKKYIDRTAAYYGKIMVSTFLKKIL